MTKRKASTSAQTGAKRQSTAKSKPSAKKTAPAAGSGPAADAKSATTETTAKTAPVAASAQPEATTAAASSAMAETTAPSAATATRSSGFSRWTVPGAIAAALAGAGLWYVVSGPEMGTTETGAVPEQSAAVAPDGERMAIQSPAQSDKAITATDDGAAQLSAGERAGRPETTQAVAAGTGSQVIKADKAVAPDQRLAAGSNITGPGSAARATTAGNTTVDAQNHDQWGRVMTQAMNPVTYFQMMAAMTQGAMNAANGWTQPAKKPEEK